MNELTDLKEAYERIEWQIKHDLDNYDKDPTVAGLMDLERIKVAIDELQSYKDKEDRLREYCEARLEIAKRDCVPARSFTLQDILQILNEGESE